MTATIDDLRARIAAGEDVSADELVAAHATAELDGMRADVARDRAAAEAVRVREAAVRRLVAEVAAADRETARDLLAAIAALRESLDVAFGWQAERQARVSAAVHELVELGVPQEQWDRLRVPPADGVELVASIVYDALAEHQVDRPARLEQALAQAGSFGSPQTPVERLARFVAEHEEVG